MQGEGALTSKKQGLTMEAKQNVSKLHVLKPGVFRSSRSKGPRFSCVVRSKQSARHLGWTAMDGMRSINWLRGVACKPAQPAPSCDQPILLPAGPIWQGHRPLQKHADAGLHDVDEWQPVAPLLYHDYAIRGLPATVCHSQVRRRWVGAVSTCSQGMTDQLACCAPHAL